MGRHYDDPLEFLLDGHAESVTDGACTNLMPSRALRAQWAEFGEAVAKAMLDWGDQNEVGDKIAEIIQSEDNYAYDVYMTLDGAGVGIWDGRWDPYLSEAGIEGLKKYLGGTRTGSSRGVLGEEFSAMQAVLDSDVYAQCRGRRARGEKLDPSLNGALDCDDLISLRAAELRELREPFKIVHKRGGGMAIRRADGSLEEPCKQGRNLLSLSGLPSWARPTPRR